MSSERICCAKRGLKRERPWLTHLLCSRWHYRQMVDVCVLDGKPTASTLCSCCLSSPGIMCSSCQDTTEPLSPVDNVQRLVLCRRSQLEWSFCFFRSMLWFPFSMKTFSPSEWRLRLVNFAGLFVGIWDFSSSFFFFSFLFMSNCVHLSSDYRMWSIRCLATDFAHMCCSIPYSHCFSRSSPCSPQRDVSTCSDAHWFVLCTNTRLSYCTERQRKATSRERSVRRRVCMLTQCFLSFVVSPRWCRWKCSFLLIFGVSFLFYNSMYLPLS